MVPGVCLIMIGLWLFVKQLTEISGLWLKIYPILILLFAGSLFFETVRRKQRRTLFWGTVVFTIGLFYLLRNYRVIPFLLPEEYWPLFLIAVGLGYSARFLYCPRDWSVLFPAGIYIFLGIVFFLHGLYAISVEWIDDLFQYWPVVLILMGVGLLAKGGKKN